MKDADAKTHGFYAGLELLVAGIQNAKDLVASEELKSGLASDVVEFSCDAVLEKVAQTEKLRHERLEEMIVRRYWDRRNKVTWGKKEPEHQSFFDVITEGEAFYESGHPAQDGWGAADNSCS